MIVVTQAHPSFRTSYQDYLPYDGVKIPGATVGPPITSQGRTFPADWKARTDSILSAVMEDPAESEEMRWAANRGIFYLRSLGDGSDWE